MDVSRITGDSVRKALRAIRYGLPLAANPLLELDALTLLLRSERIADAQHSRAWLLGRYLDDVVSHELDRARAAAGAPVLPAGAAAGELEQLRTDFSVGSPDLEAWSILHYRYLGASPGLSKQELSQALTQPIGRLPAA